MAKQDFSALMSKVKETQTNTPIQKVTSVKEKKEEILHFNRNTKPIELYGFFFVV